MPGMLLVYLLHDHEILLVLASGRSIISAAAYAYCITLELYAEFVIRGYQSSAGITIPNFFDTRFAKSSSISNSPILRCSRSFSFCLSDSALAVPPPNAALALERNSFFQRDIITDDTSYFSDNSVNEERSLSASNTTFALISGVYFLLLVFPITVQS